MDTSGGKCHREPEARAYVDADACGSLEDAYVAAEAGDIINVVDGVYGPDVMGALNKPVTVRAAGPGRPSFGVSNFAGSGVTIKGLKFEFRGDTTSDDDWVCVGPPPAGRGLNGQLYLNGIINPCASNITFDNVEIDGLRNPGTPGNCAREGIKYGGDGFTFKNGSVHGIYDRKGADLDAANITIENTTFYDIRVRNVCDPDVHNECVYIPGARGAVFRNNKFIDCPTMALFFSGEPDTDSDNVIIEGNVFTHTLDASGEWHVSPCGLKIGAGPSRINGWIVRYNTFETSPCVDDLPAGAVRGQWYGNVGGSACIPGFSYHHNVGETCGGPNSVAVSPAVNTKGNPNQAPFYVDARDGNFHLKPHSPAIDRGDPESFPATDAGGALRPVGAAPDAGAYEYVPAGSVTLQLTGSGVGSWKQKDPAHDYTESMRYRWTGSLTFTLPPAARRDPATAKFRSSGIGTLTASWTGAMDGHRAAGANPGPYRCVYKGGDVTAPVSAVLGNAKHPGRLELTIRPRRAASQFLSPSRRGASIACTTSSGRAGPPHFSPATLFRDRAPVVITLPSNLLPKRSVTVAFPRDVGSNGHNSGRLVVRAR